MKSALHIACKNTDSIELVKYLVEQGAKLFQHCSITYKIPVLECAMRYSSYCVIRYLFGLVDFNCLLLSYYDKVKDIYKTMARVKKVYTNYFKKHINQTNHLSNKEKTDLIEYMESKINVENE